MPSYSAAIISPLSHYLTHSFLSMGQALRCSYHLHAYCSGLLVAWHSLYWLFSPVSLRLVSFSDMLTCPHHLSILKISYTTIKTLLHLQAIGSLPGNCSAMKT